jgi:hypothetical protein
VTIQPAFGAGLSLNSVADLPAGGNIAISCYNNVLGGGDAFVNIVSCGLFTSKTEQVRQLSLALTFSATFN